MRALSQTSWPEFVDARFVGANAESLVGDYRDEASLDSTLKAASAAYYTDALLASMTLNDKQFAVRTINDAASFKPSGITTGLSQTSEIPEPETEPEEPEEEGTEEESSEEESEESEEETEPEVKQSSFKS